MAHHIFNNTPIKIRFDRLLGHFEIKLRDVVDETVVLMLPQTDFEKLIIQMYQMHPFSIPGMENSSTMSKRESDNRFSYPNDDADSD